MQTHSLNCASANLLHWHEYLNTIHPRHRFEQVAHRAESSQKGAILIIEPGTRVRLVLRLEKGRCVNVALASLSYIFLPCDVEHDNAADADPFGDRLVWIDRRLEDVEKNENDKVDGDNGRNPVAGSLTSSIMQRIACIVNRWAGSLSDLL